MFKNYFTIAMRNLKRHKLYSAINIFGLAVGIACCFFMTLYIADDLTYDRQHENADRIFRILRTEKAETGKIFKWGTSGALAPTLQQDFPEVENTVRIFTDWSSSIRFEDTQRNGLFCFADPSILDMFHFPLIKGDPKTALRTPNGLVLNEDLSQKFFGKTDPIGKTITIDCDWLQHDFIVTGVMQNIPNQSSFWFHALFSTHSIPERYVLQRKLKTWGNVSKFRNRYRTYIQLPQIYPSAQLEQKLPDFIERHMGAEERKLTTYHLQPLNRIHLHSKIDYGVLGSDAFGIATPIDINQLMLFSALAFFILLIACINFTNLTTARALHRAKEIGVRKVVGAHRIQLAKQFLGESFLLSSLALVLAIMLVTLALPEFGTLARKSLTIPLNITWIIASLCAFLILVGILAGSYPAFFLSRFKPIDVLKKQKQTGKQGATCRDGLVIFQFTLSVILIISTTIVSKQLHYMTEQDLGFNIDHLIDIPIFGSKGSLRKTPETVKNEFSQHSGVVAVSAISGWPGGLPGDKEFNIYPEGNLDHPFKAHYIGGDENLLDVYRIELLAGRNILPNNPSEVLLNETAVKQLGWQNPIGKQWMWENPNQQRGKKMGTVVGVIKDFHFQPMHNKIKPLFIGPPDQLFTLLVRVRPESLTETLAFLKTKWDKLVPEKRFAYGFESEHFENFFYNKEKQMQNIARHASALTIFIACLGLLGLASFMVEQRTKEMGIRKVLGASVSHLVWLFSTAFAKRILIAILIACPIAYLITQHWLQDFAYHIDLTLTPFLLSGLLALLIAWVTVGLQAFKAARANPIDTLRNE